MRTSYSRGSAASGRIRLAGLLLFLILLPLWWTATRTYQNLLLTEQRAEIQDTVFAHGYALSSAITRRLIRLQGLSAFVHAEMDNPGFEAKLDPFVTQLLEGATGARYMLVAPGGVVQYVYPRNYDDIQLGSVAKGDSTFPGISLLQLVEFINPGSPASSETGIVTWKTVYEGERKWGLVSMGVSLGPLMSESGVSSIGDQLQLALRDNEGRVFWGDATIFTDSPVMVSIDVQDETWSLAGIPAIGWVASVQRPFRVFQGVSFLVLVLFVALVVTVANRQAQLAGAVAQRTQELLTAQLELERRVAERTHQLTMLLTISANITSELGLRPLLRLILDELQKTVEYVNATIMELDGDMLVHVAFQGHNFQEDTVGRRFPVNSQEPVWEMLAAGRPYISRHVLDETPMIDAIKQVMDEDWLRVGMCIGAWLLVPLRLKERLVGVLALHHDQEVYFSDDRVQLVMTIASQAAIAIENAHLYEQAHELAGLRERQKLARDLHDSVSQALYGISLGARTARLLLERDPGELVEPLDYILSMAEAGLSEMRALVFELRPESLEREGLVAALSKQTAAIKARHQLDVVANFGDEPDVPLEIKEALYRISQEALNNIVKHARATRILASLSRMSDSLVLVIEDNGRGFDARKDYPGHLGMRSMQERSERLGGRLTIDSVPDQGTRLRLQVPYQDVGHP